MKSTYTIFMSYVLILSLQLCLNSVTAQDVANLTSRKMDNGLGYLEYLPSDYQTANKKYPLLIFLHGTGQKGNGTTELKNVASYGPPMEIKNGSNMTFTANGTSYTFIVISPQLSSGTFDWNQETIDAIVNYSLKNYKVDTCKVYLTGLSLGGGGVWSYILSDYNKKNRFAAIAPSDGYCPGVCWDAPGKGCQISEKSIPIWAFHGAKDGTVPLANEKPLIDGINGCTKPISQPKAIYTIYPEEGHGVWEKAYNTTNALFTPNLYQWMLSNTLKSCGITNVENNSENLKISISLNQTDHHIIISNPASQLIESYTLLNSLGQILEINGNLNTKTDKISLDISKLNYSSNIHFLKIMLNNNNTMMFKF